MLSLRWPNIYASGLSVNSILSDIGPQTFNALLYAVVPVVSLFIKWNVGAFFTTYKLQVSELSSFCPCLKWFFLIVGICHKA